VQTAGQVAAEAVCELSMAARSGQMKSAEMVMGAATIRHRRRSMGADVLNDVVVER
jgi:hypothetical protein